jgi:hypothetical protein
MAFGVLRVPTPYQASGSAPMTRSGISGCAKKNQWYHFRAKVAPQRERASPIGTESTTVSAVTASGWSMASRIAT